MFLLLTDPGPAERFLTGWGQSKVGSDRSRQTLHKSSSRSSGVKVRLCNIFRFCAQVMKQSHGALVNKIVDIPVLSHKSRTGDTPSFHEAQHGYCMLKPALAMRKRSLDAQCKHSRSVVRSGPPLVVFPLRGCVQAPWKTKDQASLSLWPGTPDEQSWELCMVSSLPAFSQRSVSCNQSVQLTIKDAGNQTRM